MATTRAKAIKRQSKDTGTSTNGAEVLTLAEAAAYLRVPEKHVERLVGPGGLPGRLIGSEWRFLKSALQDWLRTPPATSSKEALDAFIGCWKNDPHLDDLVKGIYEKRGRPMTEAEE